MEGICVCLPLLSDSSSALSASCTLVFGDAGCALEADQSSQSVGRCALGIPDQIPGLCCYFDSPAMTMHLGPWSNNRAIPTRSWEPCTLLTVMFCDKVRLPLARGFVLTTDLSYRITCWSSSVDYSAISTVRGTLLTDHRLMQRRTSWQPVSSSTSQANFCRLLATEALQTNTVLLLWMAGASMGQPTVLSASHIYVYWSWAWLLSKAHICRLLWFAELWPALGVLFVCCALALITGVSVCERNTWIKLPKNISRSQLTSLLLLPQSWRDAWRKFAGSTLLSGCGRIISTTDFSSPRTCQSLTAAQPRAVLETESNPMAEGKLWCFPGSCSTPHHSWCQEFPMHGECAPCAVIRVCGTCCSQTHAGAHFHLGAACWCACDISE